MAKTVNTRALLEQPFIKDTGKTVGEHIKQTISAIGENIKIRRFERCGILQRMHTSIPVRATCTAASRTFAAPIQSDACTLPRLTPNPSVKYSNEFQYR